jgi:hypothetical protein
VVVGRVGAETDGDDALEVGGSGRDVATDALDERLAVELERREPRSELTEPGGIGPVVGRLGRLGSVARRDEGVLGERAEALGQGLVESSMGLDPKPIC